MSHLFSTLSHRVGNAEGRNTRAVALFGCGIVLAACGSTSVPSKASSIKKTAKQPAKASTVKKPQKTTKNPSIPKQPSRCRSANLTVALVQFEGAAGSTIATYVFTNNGSVTCTLFGYPGLGLLGPGGQGLSTTVIRQPNAESTVSLAPGGHAWFMMEYPNSTGYATAQCPTSTSLEVTPPNSYHYLIVNGVGGQLTPYGGTTAALHCGTISVRPVTGTNPI